MTKRGQSGYTVVEFVVIAFFLLLIACAGISILNQSRIYKKISDNELLAIRYIRSFTENSLGEIIEGQGLVVKEPIQNPFVSELMLHFLDNKTDLTAKGGYYFKFYAPTADDMKWRLYAYPINFDVTGKRVFYVSSEGNAWQLDNDFTEPYSGEYAPERKAHFNHYHRWTQLD